MPSFLPAIEYPPASNGFWGPVTSTLDWCEENYYATHYIAELVNSLTNAMFVYLGVRGVRNCLVNRHDKVFLLGYLAYLAIGVGSFWFHATLTYEMQLVDEISMVYTNTVLVYAIFSHNRSPLTRFLIGAVVTTLSIAITLAYFYLGDPVFHQVAFTLLTYLILFRGIYLMETTLRPRWRKVVAAVQGRPERWTNGHGAVTRAKDEKAKQDESDARDLTMLRAMYGLLGYGVFCAVGGFTIWAADRKFCPSIRAWRREVGMPWGFLLEGHGWWHLMTGVAGHINLVWNIWMRYGLYGRRDEVELVWPSTVFSIPEVVRKDQGKGKVKKR